ncbi:transmembrane protein 42-like [Thalassophryne amazonica]|uniref:transmembrane protein 42-like n=1 Tax=Thalassophryne amazonica TaxID=390379 RepID=UPI001471E2E7|nr:transmembrane protein 42-like [Thalassophryne amazonica]
MASLMGQTVSLCSGSFFALFAGFLGASASLCAKLALGADYLKDLCESGLTHEGHHVCDWLRLPLRLLCGVLLFTCNAVMWTVFSKALRHSSSSAKATVTTTASNFVFSAFLGRLIFGESHAALWWVGISLTLCGLMVLHTSMPQSLPWEMDKKEK